VPGAGHAVNADGGGSPRGVEGVGRALWLDRRACPMASLLGQKLEEQGASSPGHREGAMPRAALARPNI
jgi:hypothetical protein